MRTKLFSFSFSTQLYRHEQLSIFVSYRYDQDFKYVRGVVRLKYDILRRKENVYKSHQETIKYTREFNLVEATDGISHSSFVPSRLAS